MLEPALAASSVIVILVAMVIFRRSAATAGVKRLVVTVGITVGYFGFPELADFERPMLSGLAGSAVEATFTAGTILWIIFGAPCLHHLQMQTDAIDSLRTPRGSSAPSCPLWAGLSSAPWYS